ncbi:MAG: hypothetical protein U1D30_10400 [Planctomycetota bacterium]
MLDLVHEHQGRISDLGDLLSVSTASITRFLQTTTESWRAAQELRALHGQKPLRS